MDPDVVEIVKDAAERAKLHKTKFELIGFEGTAPSLKRPRPLPRLDLLNSTKKVDSTEG